MNCLARDDVSQHSQTGDAHRRWVYLPQLTTAAELRHVLDGLFPLLACSRNRDDCWVIDLSGVCVQTEAGVEEIERFLRAAKDEQLCFELRGVEQLTPLAQTRIREILEDIS